MADIAHITLPNGDEYDIKDATARTGLNGKVDKVYGKGLSTNDYTTTEKNKLAGIAAGAEANVQSDWNVTDASSDAFIKNKPTAYIRGEYVPSTGITNPYWVKMFGNKRYTDYFQTIKAFAGEGDYFYCIDLNSDYTITCSKAIVGSYGNYKSIFNHNMSDTLLVRTTDLPFTIEIAKNSGNIDATDVTYLMFLSHTLGNNGSLKNYKIELYVTSKSSASSLTVNAWNTIVERTGVSDNINGLIHQLHQTSSGGYAFFNKIRLTINEIIPASTVSTAWNYNAVAITSLQLVNTRPAFTAAAALGALDIRGGTVYGPTKFSGGITGDVNGKINNHTVNSDVPADAKFTDTVITKTSELTNDSNFAVDANYVHTDNNFTTTEKNKLSGIASGAEVNVQSDWNVTNNSSDAFIKNKPSIPSATSDLTNDSNFVSDASYVHTDNNFTNALKTKLDNLPTSFPNFYVDLETMELIQDGEIQEYEFQLLDGYLIV